jgi:hypothetical protein
MVYDAIVLSNPSKPCLPVTINSNLPHIQLAVGPPDSEHEPLKLTCLVDSGASLSTASLPFMVKVATQFPWCIQCVYTAKSYTSIRLSGVVQQEGTPVTTELPVAFGLHTPYFTKDGKPATLLLAAGSHVTVNLILGLPFIEATQMIVDFKDKVIECCALDCPLFPIISRRAALDPPASEMDTSPAPIEAYEPYSGFIAEIKKLGTPFADVHAANEASPTKKVRYSLGSLEEVINHLDNTFPTIDGVYVIPPDVRENLSGEPDCGYGTPSDDEASE